ncbi:MAG: ATP-dependent protease subunit HslV [Clostridia bacterium]|nr:ATP-dependent protease subunit HslV [Clostridia bacterium]
MIDIKATTILAVKKAGKTVMIADGQVTLGQSVIIKATAHKLKRIYDGKVLVGFAGAAGYALILCEELEKCLNKFSGHLIKSCSEFAKNIRTMPHGSNEDVMMIVADKDQMLVLSSGGEVLEPEDCVYSVGSGSNYALSAAKALLRNTDFDAKKIAEEAMKIASETCVYTNTNYTYEEI